MRILMRLMKLSALSESDSKLKIFTLNIPDPQNKIIKIQHYMNRYIDVISLKSILLMNHLLNKILQPSNIALMETNDQYFK